MLKAYIDTNVILRFLVNDPPHMAEKAARLFEEAERGEVTLVVNSLIIAEVIWVLGSFYKHPIPKIANVLSDFILSDGVLVEDKETLLYALQIYETKHVDFIDAWLAAVMQKQGIREIYSFDKHFDRIDQIERREPGSRV